MVIVVDRDHHKFYNLLIATSPELLIVVNCKCLLTLSRGEQALLAAHPPSYSHYRGSMRRLARAALSNLDSLIGATYGGGHDLNVGPDDVLVEPVNRFVAEIGDALVEMSRAAGPKAGTPEQLRTDAAVEVFNLALAMVDADGRHTDSELRSLALAFAAHLPTSMHVAGPEEIRLAGLANGKRVWVDRPSDLFRLLVDHDRRLRTEHAWRYYELAMAVAHAVAATDSVPSTMELAAIDRFRSTLLTLLRGEDPPGYHPIGAAQPGGHHAPYNVDGTPTTNAPAGPGGAGDGAGAAAGNATAQTGAEGEEPSKPALPPARPLAELLEELNALVGMEGVKNEVRRVADFLQVMKLRKERGLKVTETNRHLVFTGNPGTGKTTVARLMAQIYRTLGVVEHGQLVETDRSGLVAGYVGQTATKTKAMVASALGGVLLIDEAYALARGGENDFGKEAVDTLVKEMEDHRMDLVVIVAGYPDEMGTLIASNPGLSSRFSKTIHFPDYSTAELTTIFKLMVDKGGYVLTEEAEKAFRAKLEAIPRDKGFGNGRLARNMFEWAVTAQASRLVKLQSEGDVDDDGAEDDQPAELTDEQLKAIEPADINAGH